MSQKIELMVSFDILDFALFESTAGACVDYVREQEPDTLAYEWFVDRDAMKGKLFEQYADEAAFRKHVTGPVFARIGRPFFEAIKWTEYESFGPFPQEFRKILSGIKSKNWEERICSVR